MTEVVCGSRRRSQQNSVLGDSNVILSQRDNMFNLLIVVVGSVCLGYTSAAPSTGSCECVHGSGVRVHSSANLSSSVYGNVSTGHCFIFNGGVLTKDGYTWYELQHILGHTRGWVASNYLTTSSHAQCSSVSSGRSTRAFTSGIVSQSCLQCICEVESFGCKPIGCRLDVGSDSCGYFQIKHDYWLDCGSPGKSWHACADDLSCASLCVQSYMHRYAAHNSCPLTCEGFAREHNGGPRGCHKSSTLSYWDDVQAKGCH